MRQIAVWLATTALLAVSMGAGAADRPDGFWTTPAIAGYGKIHPLPEAAYKPDRSRSYRIVFALTTAAKAPGEVNPGLERVARTVNLYAASGVPLRQLKFVAIAYG
ncbi:MAG: DsrE family protein, partial [Steroidobacteraceae bacterium]